MPDPILTALLALALVLLVVLIIMSARARRSASEPAQLTAQLAQSIQNSGLFEQTGRLERMAHEMAAASGELRDLFRLRPERGAAGEFQLEEILRDLLPADRVALRTNIPGLGTPDATVRTRNGLLLIDAKFPLEAYRDLAGAANPQEKTAAERRFRTAVRGHIDEVAKYVQPKANTLPFAVLFVPSEAVFAYALRVDPAILRESSRRGVLLAGPSTLAAHLAIVAAGVKAEHLSETAERIQRGLLALDKRFATLRSDWETMSRHVGNAHANVAKVDASLLELEQAWRRTVDVDDEE
jgi:DNA recombination protein RmuC